MNTATVELNTPAEILRFCRQQAKLTQRSLAIALKYSEESGRLKINEWESSRREMPATELLAIIEICGFEFELTPKVEEEEN